MQNIYPHAENLQALPPVELKANARRCFRDLDEIIRHARPSNDSLLSGSLGLSLYYFTLYEAFGKEDDLVRGKELFEDTFARLNDGSSKLMNPSFSKGIGGLLYMVDYVTKNELIDIDIREERAELEEYIYNEALMEIDQDFNDYLHGAFGVLFYFLERLPDKRVERYVRGILDKVFEKAVQSDDSFWLRNFLTSEDEKKEINLSLAHGQSGFMLIMLQAFAQDIYPDKIYKAVKKNIGQVLRSRQDIDFEERKYSFFPIRIVASTNESMFRDRLGWCYGDLNQLLLLYRASHAFNEERYARMANLMGGCCVIREDVDSTMCTDAHFCHGAAGLAQFYRTLYLESKFPPYLNAYFKWIEKTLQFLEKDLSTDLYKNKEAALLDGLPGIAMTLLSFLQEKELKWGKVFML
ncbi:MAG: lanthionine synthetase LanC family protein [Chitinophagaceae bacterium]